jgi:predicted RNase H-like HicB family nuclease
MLTSYLLKKLGVAKYKILEDGTYYGEIASIKGVWANGKTLEICREELQEVLEEWLILSLKTDKKIPGFSFPIYHKAHA